MIRLLEMYDRSGRIYSPGSIALELKNGTRFYLNTNEESEIIVWIPDDLRPQEYELQRMCREKNGDEETKRNMFFPQRVIYDSRTDDYCGYIAKKPNSIGELTPLHDYVSRNRHYDRQERAINAIIGLSTANIFKEIKESDNRYTIGTISHESFWIDDAFNVYYAETFSCSQNLVINENSYYTAPELLLCDTWRGNFSDKTDAFVFALILFQILTGKFPFNSTQNVDESDIEYVWGLMCDGNSIFYDKADQCAIEVMGELYNYSERILELFRKAFDYCGNLDYTQNRPLIEDWMEALSDYINRTQISE